MERLRLEGSGSILRTRKASGDYTRDPGNTNDKQVTQDDFAIHTTASKVDALREIDFGHQKEALVFPKAGS